MLPDRRLQGSVLSLELLQYFILFQSFFQRLTKGLWSHASVLLEMFWTLGNKTIETTKSLSESNESQWKTEAGL